MNLSFGAVKFRSLLWACTFSVLSNFVVRLSDSVIAGNLLGHEALAGVNLASPLLLGITFLAGLVSSGVGTLYSLAMGRCDPRRARQFFMQGVWTVLSVGGLLALVIAFGRDYFLDLQGPAPAAGSFARDYLSAIWPTAVLEGLLSLLVILAYADGDSRLCAWGYVSVFAVKAAVSALAVLLGFGTAGCAFGTVVADVIGILVMCLHFRSPANTFRPVRHFAVRDSLSIMSASFGDAAAFLCDSLLFLFLNAFVIRLFGPQLLPIAGVVTTVWGLLVVFDGIGVAVQPVVTVYYGEGNTLAVRQVMRSAMRVAILEGAALALLILALPALLVRLLGIRDPELVEAGVRAVRLLAIGFVPHALAGLFNSYYMFVGRPGLAGMLTFLAYLVMPVSAVAVGSLCGTDGVWLGLGIGPILGVLLVFGFLMLTAGRRAVPLLLDTAREARMSVFSLFLDEREIALVSKLVSDRLRQCDVPEKVCLRASLMTEEVFMVVRDRNRGRRLLGEVSLDLNDGVQLTLRDDGEIFDITDADAVISSLRTFLVASMMERQSGRLNLTTTGFNRNVFRF